MAVDTPNAFYKANKLKWRKCREFVAGSDEVKAAGERYVPRPSGLDNDEFDAYIQRGAFFNAAQRTADSLVGLVMQKPPQVEVGSQLDRFMAYFDGSGSTAEDFARDAVMDVLVTGGGCAVADRPETPEGVATRRQEQQMGLRPYASWYPVEAVLDWRFGIIDGEQELVFLKLAETWDDPVDEWEIETKPQIRVFDIREGGARCRVFREGGENGSWEVWREYILRKAGGQAFPYVPAVMFGPVRNEPDKPPLLDLVEVNRSHWQNSCDLEHGLHFTGLPTPYISGHSFDEGETVRLGSKTLIAFSEQGAKMEFASFGSEGLAGLEAALDRKEQQMAALGARMLMPEGAKVESGEALAIRRGGENSALGKLADSVSRSMELLIETMGEWEGLSEAVSFRLNTDYLPNSMTAQELSAWIGALDRGAVSQQEFFDAMKAGGMIRDDKTYEEHEEEVAGFADRPVDGDESE